MDLAMLHQILVDDFFCTIIYRFLLEVMNAIDRFPLHSVLFRSKSPPPLGEERHVLGMERANTKSSIILGSKDFDHDTKWNYDFPSLPPRGTFSYFFLRILIMHAGPLNNEK